MVDTLRSPARIQHVNLFDFIHYYASNSDISVDNIKGLLAFLYQNSTDFKHAFEQYPALYDALLSEELVSDGSYRHQLWMDLCCLAEWLYDLDQAGIRGDLVQARQHYDNHDGVIEDSKYLQAFQLGGWLLDKDHNLQAQFIQCCLKHRGYASCVKPLLKWGSPYDCFNKHYNKARPDWLNHTQVDSDKLYCTLLDETLHKTLFDKNLAELVAQKPHNYFKDGTVGDLNMITRHFHLRQGESLADLQHKLTFQGHPSHPSGAVAAHVTLKALLQKFYIPCDNASARRNWILQFDHLMNLCERMSSNTEDINGWWLSELALFDEASPAYTYITANKEYMMLHLLSEIISTEDASKNTTPFQTKSDNLSSQLIIGLWFLGVSVHLRLYGALFQDHYPLDQSNKQLKQLYPQPNDETLTSQKDTATKFADSYDLLRSSSNYPKVKVMSALLGEYWSCINDYSKQSPSQSQLVISAIRLILEHLRRITYSKQQRDQFNDSISKAQQEFDNRNQILQSLSPEAHLRVKQLPNYNSFSFNALFEWVNFLNSSDSHGELDRLIEQLNQQTINLDDPEMMISALIKQPNSITEWIDLIKHNVVRANLSDIDERLSNLLQPYADEYLQLLKKYRFFSNDHFQDTTSLPVKNYCKESWYYLRQALPIIAYEQHLASTNQLMTDEQFNYFTLSDPFIDKQINYLLDQRPEKPSSLTDFIQWYLPKHDRFEEQPNSERVHDWLYYINLSGRNYKYDQNVFKDTPEFHWMYLLSSLYHFKVSRTDRQPPVLPWKKPYLEKGVSCTRRYYPYLKEFKEKTDRFDSPYKKVRFIYKNYVEQLRFMLARMLAPLASALIYPYQLVPLTPTERSCLWNWLRNAYMWHDVETGVGYFTDNEGEHSMPDHIKPYYQLLLKLRRELRDGIQQDKQHNSQDQNLTFVYFKAAIALAEFMPSNSDDPITFEEIDPTDAVCISTGERFSLSMIVQNHNSRRSRDPQLHNPGGHGLFNQWDEEHILSKYDQFCSQYIWGDLRNVYSSNNSTQMPSFKKRPTRQQKPPAGYQIPLSVYPLSGAEDALLNKCHTIYQEYMCDKDNKHKKQMGLDLSFCDTVQWAYCLIMVDHDLAGRYVEPLKDPLNRPDYKIR